MIHKDEEDFTITGIKNKNTISYINNNIKHKIIIKDNCLILTRESEEFSNILTFELNKTTKNEYYLKEYNTSIDILIKTTKININEEKIEIYYTIIDTNEEFLYVLEMSEKL